MRVKIKYESLFTEVCTVLKLAGIIAKEMIIDHCLETDCEFVYEISESIKIPPVYSILLGKQISVTLTSATRILNENTKGGLAYAETEIGSGGIEREERKRSAAA